MFRRISSAFAAVAVAACGADQPANGAADGSEEALIGRVEILEPADGAVVGPDLTVRLSTTGVEVEPADGSHVPGRGHLHLFVDHDVSAAGEPIPAGVPGIVHKGDGSTEHALTGLAPGEHRLIAILGYGDHVPADRVATDTVRIVVEAP